MPALEPGRARGGGVRDDEPVERGLEGEPRDLLLVLGREVGRDLDQQRWPRAQARRRAAHGVDQTPERCPVL
jgi:hypothetical protein